MKLGILAQDDPGLIQHVSSNHPAFLNIPWINLSEHIKIEC